MAVAETITKLTARIQLNGGTSSQGTMIINNVPLSGLAPAKYDAQKLYNIYNGTGRIFETVPFGVVAVKTESITSA